MGPGSKENRGPAAIGREALKQGGVGAGARWRVWEKFARNRPAGGRPPKTNGKGRARGGGGGAAPPKRKGFPSGGKWD